MPQMQLLATLPGVEKVRYDYCQFGTAWRKSHVEFIPSLHILLPSMSHLLVMLTTLRLQRKVFRTSVAEPYPPELRAPWGRLISEDYYRRKHGPPPTVQDCDHKLRWCDLDIDSSGLRKRDRPELSLTDA